ncbi:hypothetical protein ACFYKX_14540 [Cytobacillus sp. FJAT-54145]|uniref:HTH cro/C1-type domain-containing protein n=1 Tax=Cytobacillus spartinae TaxID=3299023 RepID=A0ABW6KC51_9BACI
MTTTLPRHNQIGEKIRLVRKKRQMTLGELAEGICSVGKMSNIENGRQPIKDEELQLFCEKLDMPISYFADPDISEKLSELDYMKVKIGDLIGIEDWTYAKSTLENFKLKITEYQVPNRFIDYYFLSGYVYMKMLEFEQAINNFVKVIEEEEENSYNLTLKIRACNALGGIYFTSKKVTKSLYYLDKGLELSKDSPTVTKEERDKNYYNRSIIYLYLGSNYNALRNINSVNLTAIHSIEVLYIKFLIKLLEEEPVQGLKDEILALRVKWQDVGDPDQILLGWALAVYTIGTAKDPINTSLLKKLKESSIGDLQFFLEGDSNKEKKLTILQLAIYLCLKNHEDQPYMEQLFSVSRVLLSGIQHHLLEARNLFFEGKYTLQYTQDKNKVLELFKLALDTLDKEYDGFLKADIIYEISKLNQSANMEMEALEVYHNHLQHRFLFTYFHELVLPTFKF